jgi:hypothetical protein
MVGHVKLAVVSMTWKFGTFLLFLFRRLLWSRNYLFVYFMRCCDLANLLACMQIPNYFIACMYRWPTENRKLRRTTEQLGANGDVLNVYLFPSLLKVVKLARFCFSLRVRVSSQSRDHELIATAQPQPSLFSQPWKCLKTRKIPSDNRNLS